MNITELARRLRFPSEELKRVLPEFGIDIGMRAIKIDDRTAQQIIRAWPTISKELDRRRRAKLAERAAEEKRLAQESAPPVALSPFVTVREFALKLGLPIPKVISEFMKNGILASLNERVDFDTATIIAEDLGYKIVHASADEQTFTEQNLTDKVKESLESETEEHLVARPPVVVVMGHVDHGKTKLLDTIRTANVASGEAGGITQHIGAYQAEKNGRKITFIDTPGHEAFTAMRSRGAKVADVAILVVAADDGVQPQTKEVVKILEAAKLPFVVAINKIDRTEADPERIKRELSDLGVIPEEWGGKAVMVPISAKVGTGIDKLLEMVLLTADLTKEKVVANPNKPAIGTVIESHVDKGEGPVATVLIQNGTLRAGDTLAVGMSYYGRVRAMKDYRGKVVPSAPPGTPVRILGFKLAPQVGDVIQVSLEPKLLEKARVARPMNEKMGSVEKPSEEMRENVQLEHVLLKTDVLGSLEAIIVSLDKFSHPEVGVNIVAKGLGNVTEVDVLRAEASRAWIAGFNVLVSQPVAELAREKKVVIKTYKVIYDLFEDLRLKLEAKLAPEIIRTDFGDMRIMATYRAVRDAQIVGGIVINGKAVKDAQVSVIRGEAVEGEGNVIELQSGKRSVDDVSMGTECGLKVKTKVTLQIDDILHFYREEKKERKLQFS